MTQFLLAALLVSGTTHAAPPKKGGAAGAEDLERMLKSAEQALKQLEESQKAADSLLAALGIAPSSAPPSAAGKPVREPAPDFTLMPAGRDELLMLKPDPDLIARIEAKNQGKKPGRKIKYRVLTANADPSKNKVVLIDFWGAWCKPCLQAIPELQKISSDFRDRGVEVVGIAIGTEAADFQRVASSVTYALAYDNVAEPAEKAFKVDGFPTLVVVDKEGRVAARHKGWGSRSAAELRVLLSAVLAE